MEKRHKRLRNQFASLENKSSRPHSVHPKAHTPEEVNLILQLARRNPEKVNLILRLVRRNPEEVNLVPRLVRRNPEEVNLVLRLVRRDPGIGLNESYAKLLDKGYTRNFLSLYRSNRIPSRVLPSSDGKTRWLTPIQKRQDLFQTTNPKKYL